MGSMISLCKGPLAKSLATSDRRRIIRLVSGLALACLTAILIAYAAPSSAQGSAGQKVACPASNPNTFCILSGHKNWVRHLAFSPGGRYLASASNDNSIRIWDAKSGQSLRILAGHRNFVSAVAFSPGGRYLASASFDKTLKLWDLVSGKEIRTFTGHKKAIYAMAMDPSGKLLASGSSADKNNLFLWNLRTGQVVRRLSGGESWVESLAFSPDGKYLAVGFYDNTIKLWDVKSDRRRPVSQFKGHTKSVKEVAFSPDGKILASAAGDHTIRIWYLARGRSIRTIKDPAMGAYALAFSPDGKLLATDACGRREKSCMQGNIIIWNADTGKKLRTLADPSAKYVNAVAFSPDGRHLAASPSFSRGASKYPLRLWYIGDITGKTFKTIATEPTLTSEMQRLEDPNGAFAISIPHKWKPRIVKGRVSAVNPDTALKFWIKSQPKKYKDVTKWASAEVASLKRNHGNFKFGGRKKGKICGFPAAVMEWTGGLAGPGEATRCYLILTRSHQISVFMTCHIKTAPQNKKALRAIMASLDIQENGQPPSPQPKPKPKPAPKPAPVTKGLQILSDPSQVCTLKVPAGWKVQKKSYGMEAQEPQGDVWISLTSSAKNVASPEQWAQRVVQINKNQRTNWKETKRNNLKVQGIPVFHISASYNDAAGNRFVEDQFFALTTRHKVLLEFRRKRQKAKALHPAILTIYRSWRFASEKEAVLPSPAPQPQPVPKPAPQPQPQPSLVTKALKPIYDAHRISTVEIPAAWKVEEEDSGMIAWGPNSHIQVLLASWNKNVSSVSQFAKSVVEEVKQRNSTWKEIKRNKLKVSGFEVLHTFASFTSAKGTKFLEDQYYALTPQHKIMLSIFRKQTEAKRLRSVAVSVFRSWRINAGQAVTQPTPAPMPQPAPQPAPQPQPQPTPQPQPAPLPQPPLVTGQSRQVQDPNGVFSFQVPPDWQLRPRGGMIMAQSPDQRTNAVAVSEARGATSLAQWAQAMVQSWRQQIPGWKMVGQQPITVAGRQGLLIRASSQTQGVEMHVDYILVHTDQHQVMMALNCPKAEFPRHQLTFGNIVASLRFDAAPAPQPAPFPDQVAPQPPAPQPAPVDMKPVRDQGGAFALSVPANWSIQQQIGQVMATAPGGQGQIAVMAMPKQVMNLEQFAQNMISQWKLNIPNWRQVSRQNIQVSGRKAILIRATGTPGGQISAADYTLLLTGNRQILMMFSSPQAQHQGLQPLYQQVFNSFRVN
jgi:WD40 repeat protein